MSILKLFSWLVFIPFAAIVVVFAVSNRGPVPVNFWPLPFSEEISLYMLSLGTLAFGFFFGALLTWLSVAKWHIIAASRRRDTKFAEAEIQRLHAKIKKMEGKDQPKQEVLPAVKSGAA